MKISHGFRGGAIRKMLLTLKWKKVVFNGNFGKSGNKNRSVSFVLTYNPVLKKVNYSIRKQYYSSALHK